MGNEKDLDQFYTNPLIARECLKLVEQFVPENKRKSYLEPSAGSGSFSSLIPGCHAYDLDPKIEGIKQANFLELQPDQILGYSLESSTVIGNPPFGRVSSLAVKFFNHSANFSDVIAFILPKTFKKQSVHNRLNPYFHVIHEWDLPKNSFLFKGEEYDVPCVFQIWVRKEFKREVQAKVENVWFDFVEKDKAEAAIKRVGGRTGFAFLDFAEAKIPSHYFIRSKNLPITEIVDKINSIDFSKIVNSTAGVRSLSKPELLQQLSLKFKK